MAGDQRERRQGQPGRRVFAADPRPAGGPASGPAGETTSPAKAGRIVVGVDGSPPSRRALAWAIQQARLTGSEVDAVCAWQDPATCWAVTAEDTRIGALAAETLTRAIAEARPLAGERVEVRTHVLPQNAARALLDAAEGADLLVVGSRGQGGFTGALLGSVSQHCVHHAPCPVVVVRGRTR